MPKAPVSSSVRALIERFEALYTAVGRPALEGRFVALLLGAEAPVSLGEAAKVLGVTKPSLLGVATLMLERGDVKREEKLPSRQHLYSLTDHAYIFDLRTQANVSRAVAEACKAVLDSNKAPDGEAAKRLTRHASVSLRAAEALERVLAPEEAAQNADLRHHLEHNPDALPARRGRGRKPPPQPEA